MKFSVWFENKYAEAMQWRDHETAEWLLDNKDAIEYGYEAAIKENSKQDLNEALDTLVNEEGWSDEKANLKSGVAIKMELGSGLQLTAAGRLAMVEELLNDRVYDEDGNVTGYKEPLISIDEAMNLLNKHKIGEDNED